MISIKIMWWLSLCLSARAPLYLHTRVLIPWYASAPDKSTVFLRSSTVYRETAPPIIEQSWCDYASVDTTNYPNIHAYMQGLATAAGRKGAAGILKGVPEEEPSSSKTANSMNSMSRSHYIVPVQRGVIAMRLL